MSCVACGDNAKPCDYTETDDVDNATTAEVTGLTIGDRALHVCGRFDGGHFDNLLHAVDDDTFRITIASSEPVLVQIFGADGVQLLRDITVRVFDTAVDPQLLAQGAFEPTLADHGAFITDLAPGDYDFIVTARATGDVSEALPYRIRIGPMPACDAQTHVDYTEAHDGDSNTGNDMVDIDFSEDPSFTASAATDDAPEPTGLEIAAGRRYLIAGTSADAMHADEYLDRDTFDLATDDTANELAIRLDWDGDTSDLDYVVFDEAMTPIVTSNLASMAQRELAMFAVKPSTHYWLWIGGIKGSTPTAYRATTCGNHFFY